MKARACAVTSSGFAPKLRAAPTITGFAGLYPTSTTGARFQLIPALLSMRPIRRASSSVSVKRSEEHTSELQSQSNLVCRLLLENNQTRTVRLSTTRSPINTADQRTASISKPFVKLPRAQKLRISKGYISADHTSELQARSDLVW